MGVNSSIEIGEPGYEEPCGASCSANFWPTDYQRTVAVRKLLYDTEGGHYTSPIKACATLYSLSGSDYRVKTPHQYNSSCVGPEFCNMSSAFSLFHTPVNQLSQYCAEKAILTASDAMWQASWLAGCSYLYDVSEIVLDAQGPCDTAGNGFIYVFGCLAFGAIIYCIVLIVAYMGMHAWD